MTSPYYLIYNYVAPEHAIDPRATPYNIIFPDQLITRLPKVTTVVMGERTNTTYYGSWDETNGFTNPIIKIDYTFNRDGDGLLISRESTIYWMMSDGMWCDDCKHSIEPSPDTVYKLKEIKRRRQNMVDFTKAQSVDIGLSTAIDDLYHKYNTEIGLYIDAGANDLSNAIANDTEFVWLDMPTPSDANVTVRQYLAAMFLVGVQS